MFSQTPERQSSTHRDVTRRESTPRRSAAKGYVEVGKAVIERSQPAAPVVTPVEVVITLADEAPAAPDGSESPDDSNAPDELEGEAAEESPDE